jgi:predicted nucleic acid-binding protein
LRVALDTSVLISLFVFASKKFEQFKRSLAKQEIVLCSYVIDETKDVVRRKFPDRMNDVDDFFKSFPFAMAYTPEHFDPEKYPAIRDDSDLPILVSAILEDVDILISRDNDFLALEIDRPEIMSVEDFLLKY